MASHPASLTVGRPRRGPIGTVSDSILSLVRRRRLIWYLAESALRRGDGNSLLGSLWLILDPTLQLAIYYLVIGVILQRPEPAFPLFLFAAILPWRWFTMAVSSGTESVRRRSKVMQQIAFPHLVLPIAAITASLGSFVFGPARRDLSFLSGPTKCMGAPHTGRHDRPARVDGADRHPLKRAQCLLSRHWEPGEACAKAWLLPLTCALQL